MGAKMPRRGPTLLDLPDEILLDVTTNLTPKDTTAVGRASRKLLEVASTDILWHRHCLATFKHWNPKHQIDQRRKAPLSDTDWKRLFAYRKRNQMSQRRVFDSLISSVRLRIQSIGTIAADGDDAKDLMLELMQDRKLLAQNYWANVILGQIHRASGIEVWQKMSPRSGAGSLRPTFDVSPPRTRSSSDPLTSNTLPPAPPHNPCRSLPALNRESTSSSSGYSLERSIGVFDHFTTDSRFYESTMATTTQVLDALASQLTMRHPSIRTYDARKRALTVAEFMHTMGFNGVRSEQDYHALKNNFLGLTLDDLKHEGLPLVYATIFCALGARVGLDATPISFPMHVYVVVNGALLPTDDSINSAPSEEAVLSVQEPIFINPFDAEGRYEVTEAHLKTLLREMGVTPTLLHHFLRPATDRDLVLRTTHNILRSLQLMHQRNVGIPPRNPRSAVPSMNDALYAFLWATILLADDNASSRPMHLNLSRAHCVLTFTEHLASKCPWDIPLVEKFMLPSIADLFEPSSQLRDAIDEIRRADNELPEAKRRTSDMAGKVKYRIGQVFKHRRLGYQAVIRGWSASCEADEAWMMTMRIDDMAGGREQSFYNASVEDGSDRYVAEENIIITHDTPAAGILDTAGRYFLSYDEEKRCFISNIKEEFPYD